MRFTVTLLRLGTLLCAGLLVFATARPASAHDQLPPGIQWINGDVTQALAAARRDGRPLFLYWGAVWCPPCNQVKALLFRRADFQNRLRGFVPVYLDGDEEAAQIWGDRYHVVGYPTLVVLRPDGTEFTRIPGETDPAQVIHILDLALQTGRPVPELIRQFESGARLSAADWQLLASYGWELDSPLPSDELTPLLARLARAAPASDPGLSGRLWLHALASLDPHSKPWDAQGAAPALRSALQNPRLARDDRDLLIQSPTQALAALRPLPGQEEAGLREAWNHALITLSQDVSISCTERLAMAYAAADLAQAGAEPLHHPLPADQLASAQTLVAQCDASTRDELERQSVVSAESDLLQEVGLPDQAARIIEAEIPRAHVPAYFMQERAALARKLGQGLEAVDWSGQAYANITGGATRLQWAMRHLGDRMKFTPDHHAAITDLSAVVLRDARALPDAFADRNLRSLEQLHKLLDEWSGSHPLPAEESLRLRSAWEALCSKAPGSPSGKQPTFCAATPGA